MGNSFTVILKASKVPSQTTMHLLRRLLAPVLLLAWGVVGLAMATETLRVLTWPGYADADLVKVFEQRTGARVLVTVVDSDEALWEKISTHQAQDFDVFATNTAELQRYIAHDWVARIDLSQLSNRAAQLPKFRNLETIPGIVRGGNAYAIPYTYAEMGLIYDRKQVAQAPTSVKALWDPRYQGRVLLYNTGGHNFSLAALAMGKKSPFQLGKADWSAAAQQLIALRRNALTFYTQPEESVELFQKQGAALMFANYGSQQLQLLKNAGADVGYAIPQEGALAWLDCWAILRAAKNTALAHAWINYMLELGPSQALVQRQGLANTTAPSPTSTASDRLLWLEPMEDVDRRNQLWQRIVSGDRVSKVLGP